MEAVALVFAAAPVELTARLRQRLKTLRDPYVVAADAGAVTALEMGFTPDVVVGDLDSLDAATLQLLGQRGVPIESFPRDKDATDGQLAIERALQSNPAQVVLVGFVGGARLDQTLASVFLLQTLHTDAIMLDGANDCRLLRGGDSIDWQPELREIVSLLPVSEDVRGVHSAGLRWPLRGDELRRGETRSVSNEPLDDRVRLSIQHGLLLLIRHFPAA